MISFYVKPANHQTMFWAARRGKFKWENVDDIDELDHPTRTALPHVKHLASDIQAARCYRGLQAAEMKTHEVNTQVGVGVPLDQVFVEDSEGETYRCSHQDK